MRPYQFLGFLGSLLEITKSYVHERIYPEPWALDTTNTLQGLQRLCRLTWFAGFSALGFVGLILFMGLQVIGFLFGLRRSHIFRYHVQPYPGASCINNFHDSLLDSIHFLVQTISTVMAFPIPITVLSLL